MTTPQPVQQVTSPPPPSLPRVVIAFCTQCRWNLRAAYFAQELLSTFGNSIGEVALRPETGGVFTVHLTYIPQSGSEAQSESQDPSQTSTSLVSLSLEHQQQLQQHDQQRQQERTVLIWDRKAASGFPETKQLKQRVRDCIAPSKGLGHSDVGGKQQQQQQQQQQQEKEKDKENDKNSETDRDRDRRSKTECARCNQW